MGDVIKLNMNLPKQSNQIKANVEISQAMELAKDCDKKIKALEKTLEIAQNAIKAHMLDATELYDLDGSLGATWAWHEREGVNSTMLKEKYSIVYKACLEVKKIRTLRVK